jgi:formamidopyrimidine-DNA glycosylase
MPELPEVETVRRGLEPAMVGAVFRSVEMRRLDLRFPLPARFAGRLVGARVSSLGRRGKYLTAGLSTGETLVMHLGMTGRFTIVAPDTSSRPGGFHYAAETDPAHDHVAFLMEGPGGLRRIDYNDPRRFGFMDLAATAGLSGTSHFKDMGPEPTGEAFTATALAAAFATRRAPVKAALLDQRVVAGLGNIYVCEALFAAGVSPRRPASAISKERVASLHAAIRATLAEAIAAGGSSLRDFAASNGALGNFQHRFKVYDREGAPCPVCKRRVRRIVQSGRSTFYCGTCQR